MYGGMCTTEENWCTMISTVSKRAAAKDGDQARLSWHLPRRVLDRVRARLSSLSKLICKEETTTMLRSSQSRHLPCLEPSGTSGHFLTQALTMAGRLSMNDKKGTKRSKLGKRWRFCWIETIRLNDISSIFPSPS